VNSSAAVPPPSRLRWRCRRGMRELDVLLSAWLETSYSTAGDEERQAFEALLDCEDDAIWDWMMGRIAPPESLAAVIDSIGRHHADQRARP